MSEARNHDAISNHFDRLLQGIAPARYGAGIFGDVDRIDRIRITAATHDKTTRRYLLQEFKAEGTRLMTGQALMLEDLACEARFTVWAVWWIEAGIPDDRGAVGFRDMRSPGREPLEVITVDEYRARFDRWINPRPVEAEAPAAARGPLAAPITAADLRWR